MNTTAVTILKLLFQSPMTDDDIGKYIKIEKTGIYKNICLLNEILEKNDLNKIEKNEKEYSIELDSKEKELFYENMIFLSLDEKIDYLYLKLVYNGILNLEEEKKILNVSRSTINRTFKEVKEILEKNSSKIEYLHTKGIKLVKISEIEKREFCVKLMKFLMMEGLFSNPLKKLIEEIKTIEIEERFIKISEIFKKNSVFFNFPSFFFCYALEIGSEIFGEFRLFKNKIDINSCELIENTNEFNSEYKNMLNDLIYRLKIKEEWASEDILKKVNFLYENIQKELKIDDIQYQLKEMLIYSIYLGLFKKENNILKIKRVNMKKIDELLINKINLMIKELGYDFYYADLLMIIQIIKKIIIENKLKNIKILILVNELTINHYSKLLHDLKKRYPMAEIKIDAFYFYRVFGIENFSQYELVICEEKLEIKNFKKTSINLFSLNEIQDVIDGYAIEKTFCNFRRKKE